MKSTTPFIVLLSVTMLCSACSKVRFNSNDNSTDGAQSVTTDPTPTPGPTATPVPPIVDTDNSNSAFEISSAGAITTENGVTIETTLGTFSAASTSSSGGDYNVDPGYLAAIADLN